MFLIEKNEKIYQAKGLIYRRRKPKQREKLLNIFMNMTLPSIEMSSAHFDINVEMEHEENV